MSESRFRTHARGSRLRRGLAGATTLALRRPRPGAPARATPPGRPARHHERASSSSPAPRPDPVRLIAERRATAPRVPVDETVRVSADGGSLQQGRRSTPPAGALPGELSGDGTRWTADGRLEPGTDYAVTRGGASAATASGSPARPASTPRT